MKEIHDILRAFESRRREPLALATLVRARGSSYRRPGARMLVAGDCSTIGTLSGGCLEEEVASRAQAVIATGLPLLLSFDTRLRYGCHGAIDVLVEKVRPALFEQIASAENERRTCVVATIFENSDSLGSALFTSIADAPAGAFVQTIPPRIRLLLLGEGPDSKPLCAFALVLGWDLIETEEASALPDDFDEWTAAIVKTHNYGRDYAALARLLPLGLPYVALLGPRRRRDQLLHALAEEGVAFRSELFAPAGLDIGAESPEEIALAIVSEIRAVFARAEADSLRNRKAPVHALRAAALV